MSFLENLLPLDLGARSEVSTLSAPQLGEHVARYVPPGGDWSGEAIVARFLAAHIDWLRDTCIAGLSRDRARRLAERATDWAGRSQPSSRWITQAEVGRVVLAVHQSIADELDRRAEEAAR